MELTEKMIEQLKADLAKAKTYDDLMGKDGAIKKTYCKHIRANGGIRTHRALRI